MRRGTIVRISDVSARYGGNGLAPGGGPGPTAEPPLDGDRERSGGTRHTAVIADPDPQARRALRATLEADGFRVVAEAATGPEAIELALRHDPDLLLTDAVLPGGDAIEVIRRIGDRGAGVPTVILAERDGDDEAAIAALRAGAHGYLAKTVDHGVLPRALRGVLKGEPAIPRRLGGALVDRLRAAPEASIGVRPVRSPLTPREWEVFDLLCQGRTTDEIARDLVLSGETIRSHVKHILRKLEVGTRAEAVALAGRLRVPADR
jgi:DNA-binding NarL/FixJ family response regulator